jgi:hypothetical protein
MRKSTTQALLKRHAAIIHDDLAYELRFIFDCLNCETYPSEADINAARTSASILLKTIKQSPHKRIGS